MEKRLNKNRYETSWNDLRDMWQREVVKKRDMWQNQRASPKTYDLIKNEQNLALYQLIKHKFVMINQIKPTQHLNILSNLFQIKMFLFNKMNKIQFRALFTRWKEMYLYIMKHATEFILKYQREFSMRCRLFTFIPTLYYVKKGSWKKN